MSRGLSNVALKDVVAWHADVPLKRCKFDFYYGYEKFVGELSCEKFVSGFHFAFNLVGRAVIQFGIFYNQPN